MKRYEPSTPRTAFGLAAVALTAVTLGVWVIAPAGTAPATAPAYPLASVQPVAVAPADSSADVTRIEVIAVRPAHTMQVSRAVFHAKHRQQS